MSLYIDHDAAIREGLEPVNCPKCGDLLAYQSADGNTLHFNQNASTRASKGRIPLRCKRKGCKTVHEWRPARGPKKPQKSLVSGQTGKRS